MASITLNSVVYAALPSVNQTVTVRYRLTSDPDIIGSYTTVTTSAIVLTNGNFVSPVVISGLANNTQYTVWITNNCGGTGYKNNYTTPLPSCVEITNMNGTTSDT